jgi:transcriptional regulator with PAS, ATPase and Fis domain
VAARALRSLAPPASAARAQGLVGESPCIVAVLEAARRIARHRSNVLITGETGTGKGVLARAIHRLSDAADRPFVHVDCAALAPSLIEGELFGHQQGAFTGAVRTRAGRFEVAAEGTIFLDEIVELTIPVQAKLLRVLEDRAFERIGSARPRPMRARVIAAANRELSREVEAGRFRRDLFFRIDVCRLELPALRDRLEDLPGLVRAGLARIAERLSLPVPVVSEAFVDRLLEHAWPGNVRELMNWLERALVASDGAVLHPELLRDLGARRRGSEEIASLRAGPEARAASRGGGIEHALLAAGGNLSRAARSLGLPRSTLRYRVRRLDLESERSATCLRGRRPSAE